MPEYRRVYVEGGTYFITLVTYNRQPIFLNPQARTVLRDAWKNVIERFPFKTDAICLLPDHLHTLITLPDGDSNYSMRIREIKRLFTRFYSLENHKEKSPNASHIHQQESAIWQRRFWEHTILDEEDLNHHFDYIHYNPVKHGLVIKVFDWPWSSFHRYVKKGFYNIDWGENYSNSNNSKDHGDL